MHQPTRALARSGVALALAGCIAAGCSEHGDEHETGGPERLEHPNVVLLIIDTLRADRLGAYGFPHPSSPELDHYAQEGVRFERVIAQCTWTRPSIASLLTSRYPRSLGLYSEDGDTLADSFTTLAELFDQAGYWTGGATANPNINRHFNFDQGFDFYLESDVVFPYMPGFEEQSLSGRATTLPRAGAMLNALIDAAVEQGPPPYYLQANLMEVHEYLKDPEPRGEPYDALSYVEASRENAQYLKSIRKVSREIDRFIRRLVALPEGRDTIFVITSDHGETLAGDHPGLADPKWHGYVVYESQTLVPWILYSSSGRLPAGRVVERPVRLLDLMPTVLEIAGIPGPDAMAGSSLVPLLRDPGAELELPSHFVVESEFRQADKAALYDSEWIYVENYDGHPGTRLREIQRVGETADGLRTDLSREHPAIVESLGKALAEWKDRTPRATATPAERAPSETTLDQLRSLGYVD